MTPIALASGAYAAVGLGTAVLARGASAPAAVTAWRLAAWLLALAIFVLHFVAERRRHSRASRISLHVALAVAIGAFVLAALGPVRAHWAEPSRARLAVLSLVAWPILTAVPAFFVALVGALAVRARLPQPRRQDA